MSAVRSNVAIHASLNNSVQSGELVDNLDDFDLTTGMEPSLGPMAGSQNPHFFQSQVSGNRRWYSARMPLSEISSIICFTSQSRLGYHSKGLLRCSLAFCQSQSWRAWTWLSNTNTASSVP